MIIIAQLTTKTVQLTIKTYIFSWTKVVEMQFINLEDSIQNISSYHADSKLTKDIYVEGSTSS